jgi:hypothetical protein
MLDIVVSELRQIQAANAIEAKHLREAQSWVESGSPLFRFAKPAEPPKHLVSYFAVVDSLNVRLVDYKNAQRWLPTGGPVEPGEHPRRIVSNDTAIHVNLVPIAPWRQLAQPSPQASAQTWVVQKYPAQQAHHRAQHGVPQARLQHCGW